jgi:2-dehydro-3-deoxyphosphogluconate aldolase/(4S)-4-hydroxy-2-oxoglutarate aldolase
MSTIEKSFDIILKQKMLPLYFNEDKEVSIEVLKALYSAGIRSVEYTNRGTNALENFKAMIALRNAELPEMELGVGTIKTVEDAKSFIEAGANYVICPGLIPDVVKYVQNADHFRNHCCRTVGRKICETLSREFNRPRICECY